MDEHRHGWLGSLRDSPGALQGVLLGALMLAACASAPQAQPAMSGTARSEADAIAAAKRSPVAQPQERALYPAQRPPALAQREPAPAPPPPAAAAPPSSAPPTAAAAPAAAPAPQYQGVASQPPPVHADDAERYAAPSPYYLWAPGYWSWHGGRYVWIGGAWIPRRPGYSYVHPRWVYTDYGWSFAPGGWATLGSTVVVYPVHNPRAYAHRHHHHYRQYRRTPVYSDRDRYRGDWDRGRSRYSEPRHRAPVYEPSRSSRSGSSDSPRMPSSPGRRIR